jgi:predicted DsbA family dithiol-disulfide isomerase
MSSLSVDIVSDVVCPWCYIGVTRLEAALEALPKPIRTTLRYRPYLLDPSTPPEGADLRAMLLRRFGTDPEKLLAEVETAARRAGIPLDYSKVRREVPTVGAHTLLRHAIAKGTQPALAKALFSAYFLDGRDVGRSDVLTEVARKHGFDAREADTLLRDEAELAATRQEAAIERQEVKGVPFFVFGGRVGVSGAELPDVFQAAIAQAMGKPSQGKSSATP